MSDISKCSNEDCPLKESCYRYKVKPHPFRQAYTTYEPNKDGKTCNHFIEIRNGNKRIQEIL